jgi:hypothetical protein
MNTEELQRIDELVHSADMAVRVASQLRLWLKRNSLGDEDSLRQSLRFLDEAISGGKFVATGNSPSGSSSLTPLTWTADIRFGGPQQQMQRPDQKEYEELVDFLTKLRGVIQGLLEQKSSDREQVESASVFFSQLGGLLGGKADSALRIPAGGTQLFQDQFSFQ